MRGDARVPRAVVGGGQNVTTSGSSARTTSGVDAQTRVVTVSCTEGCYYAMGNSSVAATTADTFLPGGGEHYVRINGGEYVAAIQESTSGKFHVSEFDQ